MADQQTEQARHELDAIETQLIRAKAAALVHSGRVPRSELEDVCQELALAVWVAHGKVCLNPETRHGLSREVADHAASNLLRTRRCSKRQPVHQQSLEAIIGEGRELSELARPSTPSVEAVELRMDIESVLAKSPRYLREVAELMKTRSINETADVLGVSRSTVSLRLRALRKRFVRAGLEKYLPPIFVTSDPNGVIT